MAHLRHKKFKIALKNNIGNLRISIAQMAKIIEQTAKLTACMYGIH